MPYRWQGSNTLTRSDSSDVEPGDEFEPTDAEQSAFRDLMEPVDEEAGDDGDATASDNSEPEPVDVDPHPGDLTVSELEDRVEDIDDVELLEAILAAEQEDGSPRSTAVDAIQDRINDLEG